MTLFFFFALFPSICFDFSSLLTPLRILTASLPCEIPRSSARLVGRASFLG